MRFKMFSRRTLIFLLIFLITGVVSANEVINGELCTITADQVIESDVFVFCTELVVDGHIQGHLIGAARTARINGQVDGSIYLLGGEMIVQGTIGKDVHFGGVVLRLEDQMKLVHESGSVLSINLSNTIGDATVIPGGVLDLGYQLIMNGTVGHDISFWGSALNIAGNVEGNVNATVGNSNSTGTSAQIETLIIPFQFDVTLIDPGLVIGSDGTIQGKLDYTGPTPGVLEGQVNEWAFHSTQPELLGTTVQQSARTFQRYLSSVWSEFSTLGFIGAIFLLLIPRQLQAPSFTLRYRPISTLGVGMLTFILSFPIVLIIAVVSIIIVLILSLLPLDDLLIFGGVALALANVGWASVFYFTAIYIARIIVALAIGRVIVRLFTRHFDGGWRHLYLSLASGLLVISLLGSIPVIGWGFNALFLFMGLGALLSVLRAQFKRFTDTPLRTVGPFNTVQNFAPMLPSFTERESNKRFAPPILKEKPPSPGTENLPDGFSWWDED